MKVSLASLNCSAGHRATHLPGHESLLGGTRNRQRPDGVGVAVAVAVIVLATPIAGRPDEDGALSTASLPDALDEGPRGHIARSVHRFPVIVRTPRGTVDVDMLRVQTERFGLDHVRDVPVQHPDAADAGSVRDAHGTLGVVGRGGDLTGAPCPVPVRVR